MTSGQFTRVGYPEGVYAGRVCSIRVVICGCPSRAGDIINALCGTNFTHNIYIREQLSDKVPDTKTDATVATPNDKNECIHNSDNNENDEEICDSSPYSSPFQQACPYTISDIDSDSQDTNKTNHSNITIPIFNTPDNSDAEKTDMDKTPEIHTSLHDTVLMQQTTHEDIDKVTSTLKRRRHMRIRRKTKNRRHMRIRRIRRQQETDTTNTIT